MSCPRAYCTSGLCVIYTPEERAQMKELGRKSIQEGTWAFGRSYVGIAFLVEDGEAEGYVDLRTGEYRHRFTEGT